MSKLHGMGNQSWRSTQVFSTHNIVVDLRLFYPCPVAFIGGMTLKPLVESLVFRLHLRLRLVGLKVMRLTSSPSKHSMRLSMKEMRVLVPICSRSSANQPMPRTGQHPSAPANEIRYPYHSLSASCWWQLYALDGWKSMIVPFVDCSTKNAGRPLVGKSSFSDILARPAWNKALLLS